MDHEAALQRSWVAGSRSCDPTNAYKQPTVLHKRDYVNSGWVVTYIHITYQQCLPIRSPDLVQWIQTGSLYTLNLVYTLNLRMVMIYSHPGLSFLCKQ